MTATPRAPRRWDRDAIVAGLSVAAMIAVPAAVLGRWGVDRDWEGIGIIAVNLVMLGGLFLGAGVAAWRQREGTPLSHGLVVGLGAYVAIQVAFIALRLVRGDEVSWGSIVVNVFFALGAGYLGGFAGQLLLSRGLLPPTVPGRPDRHDPPHHLDDREVPT